MKQMNAVTEGWTIAILTPVCMFFFLWVILSLEGWWHWADAKKTFGWSCVQLFIILPLYLISLPIIFLLTLFGMYSAATMTRDWWHKK